MAGLAVADVRRRFWGVVGAKKLWGWRLLPYMDRLCICMHLGLCV